MLVISSREFRDKQKSYLDQADAGVEILIQRGKNRSYKVVPVAEGDTVVSKEHILAPDAELARAMSAEELLVGIEQDIRALFRKRRLGE